MERIVERLREIWDSEENALKCGGTYSSHNLREALALATQIEEVRQHPEYEAVLERLNLITAVWRAALDKHNSNKDKFIAYDLETGLPVK